MANNTAENRGGTLFLNGSGLHIIMNHKSKIVLHQNKAISKGGAIFILDTSDCENLEMECFLEVRSSNSSLCFDKNIANSGSVLYGGLLDRCYTQETKLLGIDHFKQHSQYDPPPLAITSDPVRVCLCINSTLPNCDNRMLTSIKKMRGETIKLTVAAVDQVENPVISVIRAYYNEPSAEVDVGEGRRTIQGECTTLFYHVFATESPATLVLEPVGICERSPFFCNISSC